MPCRVIKVKFNTFSIIARCKNTGYIGAAVATCFPAAGAHSPVVKAGVGAVATQGWVNPFLGKKGLELLECGFDSQKVLTKLLQDDPGKELRQLAVIDNKGNCAAYTGTQNDDFKGHIIGDQYCIQGNLLANNEVLEAMALAFEKNDGHLAQRLLSALAAGEKAGGDRRGKQSAAIKVEAIDGFPYVNLRVDDHDNPVSELRRIYEKNKHILVDKYDEWVDAVRRGIKLK